MKSEGGISECPSASSINFVPICLFLVVSLLLLTEISDCISSLLVKSCYFLVCSSLCPCGLFLKNKSLYCLLRLWGQSRTKYVFYVIFNFFKCKYILFKAFYTIINAFSLPSILGIILILTLIPTLT